MAEPKLSRQLRDVEQLQKQLKRKPEEYWIKRGEHMALELFHDMAERVPAYRAFLADHGIKHKRIKTIADFKTVPTINKDNYLRKYARQDLCWDGVFSSKRWVVSTTSGSTGEPFYFPRTDLQDEYYAVTAELYLRENFKIHERRTLYIDAFAMGAWIGGVFTYEAIHRVALRGYPLSIITPGINKAEVISSVRRLGKEFDQVIIGCYPPIMRDIIDLGIEEGLDWADYNLGIVFSAEGFSESFRDYVTKYGSLANIYTSSLNHYGTVDLGTMSHETPLAILARRTAVQNPHVFKDIFGEVNKLPTFTQYVPEMFYFESQDEAVLCSSYGGLPLVRYDLKDHGGVITQSEVREAFTRNGLDLQQELKAAGISDTVWNLPFAYVYERSDFSVTFSGAQIYPEEIRRALLDPTLHDKVTGKFTMATGYDSKARTYLEIHVEMRRGVEESKLLTNYITDLIVQHLLKDNSEYRVLYAEYKSRFNPRVKLWSHEDPLYFNGRGKQKWVHKG